MRNHDECKRCLLWWWKSSWLFHPFECFALSREAKLMLKLKVDGIPPRGTLLIFSPRYCLFHLTRLLTTTEIACEKWTLHFVVFNIWSWSEIESCCSHVVFFCFPIFLKHSYKNVSIVTKKVGIQSWHWKGIVSWIKLRMPDDCKRSSIISKSKIFPSF